MRITTSLSAVLLAAALATPPARAQGPFDAEAIPGQPFGVGRITFDLPPDLAPEPLGAEGIGLVETGGRVFYPAVDTPAAGKLLKEVLEANTPLTTGGPVRREVGGLLRGILDRPPRTTVYFLFRGDGPLQVTLQLRGNVEIAIVPRPAVETRLRPLRRDGLSAHGRLLRLWWQHYAKVSGPLQPKPDYPPLVENYLTATLARRLNLRLPDAKQAASAYDVLRKEVGLNLGTESLRTAMQQDRILGLNNLAEPADRPMPAPRAMPELPLPEPPAGVKIEPLAMRVPAECFYVRFGSFANFLWMQDTLARWGGDAQNLIALRGLDRGMSKRMETQLVLKQTALSRMLGPTVIADVAIVGTDMFFGEGASYGLLFQARNNFALSASMAQQRQERVKAGGVVEEKITIGGRPASYLASPDGRVRSYYVVDGDFHFFTTSRQLAARFVATAAGMGSLGGSREFRHARSLMPIEREDTVWLYVSDAFFQNITGPRYRVEMARRLQAAADIELVRLARLAAVCEGQPGETIEQLKSAGLLPPEFGPLPDGSRVVVEGNEVFDSRRGRLGAFLPVADVPDGNVSKAEASEYLKFLDYYRDQWGRMDPIVAGVKRKALPEGREQITADVLMCPLAPQHFTLLQRFVGPADNLRLAPIAGDMGFLEMAMTDHRIFGGLCDMGPPAYAGASSWLAPIRLRDWLVGYIGTSGQLGLLSLLDLGVPPGGDADGYARSLLGGGWRRQFGQFTVFSFQREVLEAVAPQLRFEPAARPAQIRLRVGDISSARVTPILNDLGYARTRETSLGNLRFLHALEQQLRVPAVACRDTAETLFDAKMICPLGGQYVLRTSPGGEARWTSTTLQPADRGGFVKVHAPPGYLSPPLNWFRGLDLEATMTEKSISAHAEVMMQMPK
jgi:hypothetical protein